MEDLIKAIVYGIIQGLTEFIPVSSTAHLRVIPALLGWNDVGAAYTAVIQIGTLLATFVYFKNDILDLIKGFLEAFKTKDFFGNPYSRLFIVIMVGTIPIALAGVTLKKLIEGDARGLYVVSAMLILMALVLWMAEKAGKQTKDFTHITFKDGFLIGCAQALALIPGTSRSGITIAAGLFSGLKRDAAARYSFLLSIPAVTLSGFYELYQERDHLLAAGSKLSLVVATIVSGIVGYFAIKFLLAFLKTRSNLVFIIYRIILGIIILILLYTGVVSNLTGVH
ncbi:MAG TPA: undecaprenyl-diphosphate phosphatase [Ignavibacteria bacterium]|jgi:undecaprenyl-diphosphatase